MTDIQGLEGVTKIGDIKLLDRIGYLGIYIYWDRPRMMSSIYSQIKKYMNYLKIVIKSDNCVLVEIIFTPFSAFY